MRRYHLVLAVAVLSSVAGCARPSGGGSTSVNGRAVGYGIGEGGVAFVLFTDIPTGNVTAGSKSRSGLSSSQVTGRIGAGSGPGVDYASDFESITIAGKKHSLAKGRVFLVSRGAGGIDVRQLSIPIEPTGLSGEAMKGEINRLAQSKDVAEFLSQEQGD